MSSTQAFQKALHNFTQDVASGDAIRHLAASGMTVKQIHANLTYPATEAQVASVVWEYYLSSGIMALDSPDASATTLEEVNYVTDMDSFGRTSYRRVVTRRESPVRDYVPISFGRELYREKEAFLARLASLDSSDRDYVLGLPWPLQTVYHVADDRILRILATLAKEL